MLWAMRVMVLALILRNLFRKKFIFPALQTIEQTWAIAIGIFIGLWIWLGKVGFQKLNVVAVVLLFVLTLILCGVVFKEGNILLAAPTDEMSFGAALELSIIMPLSWLPLTSDYTRFAKSRKSGLVGSFMGYFIGSSLMYAIGLAIALYAKDASVGYMMELHFLDLTVSIRGQLLLGFL